MLSGIQGIKEVNMSDTRFLDWLGSAALTIALVSMFLLFVPGLVRADTASITQAILH